MEQATTTSRALAGRTATPGFNSMLIRLTLEDRQDLEQIANRKIQPTSRQKARALLGLAAGQSPKVVAQHVGITMKEIAALIDHFADGGLKRVGLSRPARKVSRRSQAPRYTTIEKTRGVCGGAARIAGTRIPVWQLIEARDLGASEAQLLADFPRVTAMNLVDAWTYADDHPDEIAADIHANALA
jgi:uncharacterized protein (DUF433 family)